MIPPITLAPSVTGGFAGPATSGLEGRLSFSAPFSVGSGDPQTVPAVLGKVLPIAIMGAVAWLVLSRR